MFKHFHPYEIFIPQGAKKLIVGTLPPPRFCTKKFKAKDVNFCYGSEDNLLWKILEKVFHLKLEFAPTFYATKQRKDFLIKEGIGICDIVEYCYREKIDASDLGMKDVVLRDLIVELEKNPTIKTILFMGGSSKNGPEYFFKKQIKSKNIKLTCKNANLPKVHEFVLDKRVIKTISLTSPSNAANRSIGANVYYKEQKRLNSLYSTFDFRVEQYKEAFT